MEFGDIVAVVTPGGLARSIWVNDNRFTYPIHILARVWLVSLIVLPTAVAAVELWLGIKNRDFSKVSFYFMCGMLMIEHFVSRLSVPCSTRNLADS